VKSALARLFCGTLTSAVMIAAAIFGFTQAAHAQAYPTKNLRLVISYPPGGVSDLLARILAQKLQASLGQSVIVDNRPGGNFVIASEVVAKAPPDGYTLYMVVDSAFTLNPLTISKLPYNVERDFTPISLVALQTLFMVANPRAPGKNFNDLLQYAKANPGKVTFGTSGFVNQMVGEQIKVATGANILHVPFKGSPPMLQALLAGDIHFSITTFTPYATLVKEGKLRGLAVTGDERAPLSPDTPTLAELGHKELTYRQWFGFYAPAGVPKLVMDRLLAETAKALNDPDLRQRFTQAGVDPAPTTPAQMAAIVRRDLNKWAKVIKVAGIKLE
jgi:tripartite-type tricarboxylate transporter receptor subunit TctC